jgi:Tol biopolymer transport system component
MIVAESVSILGDLSTPLGLVLRVDAFGDKTEPLFWVQSVWAGSGDFVRFEFLNEGSLVFDEILWRGSLNEVSLDGSPPYAQGKRLTQGNSRDRQPSYAPDGESLVFSSNRSGNLDIWLLEISTGAIRQLTDDSAEDWDPAFSTDGKSIFWSSSRSGNLEIWTARADGSGARQFTHDGIDAENPTQTRDGEWVVYSSGNLSRNGIWKIRTDGSEEVRLAAGAYLLPEISPDGRYVSYLSNEVEMQSVRLNVAELESGEIVFETDIPFRSFQNVIQVGRSRWMPDGRALVFVGPGPDNRSALFAQDFAPGEDTTASRRLIIHFDSGEDLESFGIAPDGRSLTVARFDHFRSLKLAEGVER